MIGIIINIIYINGYLLFQVFKTDLNAAFHY